MSDAAEIVRRFCDDWSTITEDGGMDRVLAYFTDDAEYHNIPVQCQGHGTTATTDKLDITMNINSKRKFSGHETLNGGKVTATVHGRFAKDFSKGHGNLRVHGTVPGCASADTGVVQWHVSAV